MKIIRKVVASFVFIVIAAVVVMFALANRGEVVVNLWPLPFSTGVPLSVAVLGALAVGILAGGVISWTSGASRRLRHRPDATRSTTLPTVPARERQAEVRPSAGGSSRLPAVAD